MKRKAWRFVIGLAAVLALLLAACGNSSVSDRQEKEEADSAKEDGDSSQKDTSPEETGNEIDNSGELVTILAAAAASLEYSFEEELIPMFEAMNPAIAVEGSYDSSGKLKTQIEEGMDADVFMSAAVQQMDDLKEEKLIDEDSIVNLLENEIVLIQALDQSAEIKTFEDIVNANVIAVGDPESVPAGQYAKEALTSLGLWDEVEEKASLGTNVTEVLNWVAEGSADVGIVYATDAAANDKVTVIAKAPKDALVEPVLYPAGIVTASTKKEAAQLFLEFLQSKEALEVFEKYGFTPNIG